MLKTPPKIELSWRDENYGSVYAVTAFRNYAGTLDWSDRTHQRFRGYLKRAGFEFHYGRCSYIAKSGEREERQRALSGATAPATLPGTALYHSIERRPSRRCGVPAPAGDDPRLRCAPWPHPSSPPPSTGE